MKRPTALGAYIFAGGFTVGVKKHFDVLAHFEGNDYGVSTAKLNWPDLPIFYPKLKWPVADYAGKVDFLYCNPPCAIFSTMGISTTRGKGAWKDDPRLGCWLDCFELVEELQPKVWAIESVTQAYGTGRPLIDELTWRGRSLGYSVTHLFVNAKWHGVPQERKRFFLVGHRTANLIYNRLNWAPPTTVGEALREAASPGAASFARPDILELAKRAAPGERLSSVFDRITENPETWPDGRVRGRPSFQDRRLDPNEVMGAFTGDKFWYDGAKCGENQQKALCGYPQDFQLDGPIGGRASLLARAVMPPVGAWIASAALNCVDALNDAGGYDEKRQTNVWYEDLREPGRDALDLTSQYVSPRPIKGERIMIKKKLEYDNGTTETVWCPELDDEYGPKKRPSVTADGLDEFGPDLTRPRDPLAEYGPANYNILDYLPGSGPVVVTTEEPVIIPATRTRATRVTPLGDIIVPSDDPPAEGEGSGHYIKRLLLTGQHLPEEIVALVHKHYEGRTTKVGDVYYNYRKLVDDGRYPDLKPWPGKAKRAAVAPPAKLPSEPRAATPTNRTIGAGTILLTGCTPIQVGSPHTQLKILTAATGWKIALEKMGYSVDWRPVAPGEDVSAYHRCFVILNKPNAIVSKHFYGALWTLLKRPDAILAFDDWQTRTVVPGIVSCAKDRRRAFRLFQRSRLDDVSEKDDELFQGLQQLANLTIWPWPAIVPVFRGGDLTQLGVPASVFAADPTILTPRYDRLIDAVKKRAWVQASLLLKPPPVGLTWPVQFFGNAGRGRGGVGKSDERPAETRLTEPELMRVYGASWGILSPAHTHPGSGWWRVRYLMSADAGCVLSAHPDEARVLGDPYSVAADPRKIEKMSDSELECLAQAQAQCLERVAMSEDELCHVLRTVMEK